MTKRRKLTTSFKKTVTLAALRGDKTIQELAAHYQVHPTQINTWKRQAIDGLDGIFDTNLIAVPEMLTARLRSYMPRSGSWLSLIVPESDAFEDALRRDFLECGFKK